MPPLAVAIPVISRSEQNNDRSAFNSRDTRPPALKPRVYSDGPLPTKPSDSSPKQARIIDRNEDRYHLRIGDIDLRDIGIEEVLDYVSQLDLEQFENRQFVEERSVLDVLKAEKAQLKREKLELQKYRAKTKGVALEEVDSAEETGEGGDVAVGKHGRARPTYTHLFKRPELPKKRRDLDSEDDISADCHENEAISTENEPAQPSNIQAAGLVSEVHKRRRRKRDKITGELLPLSPIEQKAKEARRIAEGKRPRRKRHPLTGELMPLGWRYDPDNENDSYEKRRDGVGSHSFRHLSISEEPLVKRQRLDVTSSISRSPSPLPTKAQLAAQHTPAKLAAQSKSSIQQPTKEVYNLVSSDEESAVDVTSTTPRNLKPLPKPLTATPKPIKPSSIHSTESSSEQESSPEPIGRTSTLQHSASKAQSLQRTESGKTSIMHPSFKAASSVEPSDDPNESDEASEDNDLDEGEWFIEDILGHQWSDPSTHPAEFGKDPVMLYLVKWEGYDDPTYEPADSFGDQSVLLAYRRKVGLDLMPIGNERLDTFGASASLEVAETIERPSLEKEDRDEESEGDDDGDEEQFEVENILDHRLSDPKTHPRGLGSRPVVLYQVKWRGFEELTWEPASSFEDKAVLQQYHTRRSKALKGLT